MASVYNRGTRAVPKWCISVQHADGVWRSRRVHCNTAPEAREIAEHVQGRINRGLAPFEEDEIAAVAAAVEAVEAAAKAAAAAVPRCEALMPQWLDSLTNRNAPSDRWGAKKHIVPAFKDLDPREIERAHIVKWLDTLKAGDKPLSGGSQRFYLNLLSRFFGWAISRGYATVNPVKMLPTKERPKGAPKPADAPWLNDDAKALAIAGALPSPLGLVFFIGYRCGMRPGEVAGLRISDLADLDFGRMRVRYSEAGPLKEDRGDSVAKMKWAPAPEDVQLMLSSWLAKRELAQPDAEDYVFRAPTPNRGADRGYYPKHVRHRAWHKLPEELHPGMPWYEATRHSFASGALEAGVPLDEVSQALGHSSPVITARHYSRFIRKDFSRSMLRPLKLTDAKILPFKIAAK